MRNIICENLTITTKCIKFVTNDMIVKRKTIKYSTKEKEEKLTMVMEKEMPSFSEASFSSITSVDAHNLINRTRTGISMHQLEKIINRYDLTLKEIAAILNVSERTLQRYENADILSKDASDRALHLQRLYEKGAEVFGSLDKFKGWMKSNILYFKNEKPITFLDTIFGFELLEQELGRIEHGIFA